MSNNNLSWTSPKVLIVLFVLIVLIFGNIYQYSSLEFEKEKWSLEKKRIEQELRDNHLKINRLEHKTELLIELLIVENEIKKVEEDLKENINSVKELIRKAPKKKDEKLKQFHLRAVGRQKKAVQSIEKKLDSLKKRELDLKKMIVN